MTYIFCSRNRAGFGYLADLARAQADRAKRSTKIHQKMLCNSNWLRDPLDRPSAIKFRDDAAVNLAALAALLVCSSLRFAAFAI
jgi:hypothetical protein